MSNTNIFFFSLSKFQDKANKRRMLMAIDRRKKLLKRLRLVNYDAFERVCEQLGITYTFPPEYYRRVTRRWLAKKALCIKVALCYPVIPLVVGGCCEGVMAPLTLVHMSLHRSSKRCRSRKLHRDLRWSRVYLPRLHRQPKPNRRHILYITTNLIIFTSLHVLSWNMLITTRKYCLSCFVFRLMSDLWKCLI